MNENHCPSCSALIPLEQINIKEGVALCSACGQLSRLSSLVDEPEVNVEPLPVMPHGCSLHEAGDRIVTTATMRSIPAFIGCMMFGLFWNGIVSIFVLFALSGLYQNLIGPLPVWFPVPDAKPPMTLGVTLFLCCFLVPFVTVGMVMFGLMLLYLIGKVTVEIAEDRGLISSGFGFIQWRQRFDPTQVEDVTEGITAWETNGRPSPLITIEADRTIKFGSMLEDRRRNWLRIFLQRYLTTTNTHEREQIVREITSGLAATP